jgi:lipopolysaccharide transport system ATP-binding protein
MNAITVTHVSKRYLRHTTPAKRLAAMLSARTASREQDSHWALREVSFSVQQGESVGILGQNGAGKSTLLKIITGTTAPSSGSVHIAGRVAALLELGMGFHPEFTGRNNLVIAGQLLGLTVQDIQAKLPAIEAFAQIGDYINEPVRTYSSGMQVRLAFALATAVRPDVLIVDEALSVGDIFFQQKCFERIREFREHGTTLLFVSHDLGAIHHLCDRAILLEGGQVRYDGAPKGALDLYQANLLKQQSKEGQALTVVDASESKGDSKVSGEAEPKLNNVLPSADHGGPDAGATATSGNEGGAEASNKVEVKGVEGLISALATVEQVRVCDQAGKPVDSLVSDDSVQVQIAVRFHARFADPHVGFKLRDRLGRVIFETNTYCMKTSIAFAVTLHPGEYTLSVGVSDSGIMDGSFQQHLAHVHDQAMFAVLQNRNTYQWSGICNLKPTLSIQR